MTDYEVRVTGTAPEYKPTNGVAWVEVYNDQTSDTKAKAAAADIKAKRPKLYAHVVDVTDVPRFRTETTDNGVRVYLRAPASMTQKSAFLRMAHRARQEFGGGRVLRITGGAHVTPDVIEWQAFYVPRRQG